MCVIAAYTSSIPSITELEAMEAANPDGGGIAWRKGGKVHFKKGLSAKEVHEIASRVPLPVVVHFRLATHGGKAAGLCHPFPIADGVPLDTEGTADKVLFHNGVWSGWDSLSLLAVVAAGKKFVDGPVSDTRAMAWLVYHYGESVLSLVGGGNKMAVMSLSGITLYGAAWEKTRGNTYSNLHWLHRPTSPWIWRHGLGETGE